MRKTTILVLWLMLAVCGERAGPDRTAESRVRQRRPVTISQRGNWKAEKHTDGMDREYYLYLPKQIVSARKYWLVVGVHGLGGNGQYASAMCDFVKFNNCIVVGPTFTGGHAFLLDNSDKQLLDLAKELGKKYKLHERMFVMGFSAGAQVTRTRFALKYPQAVVGCAAHSGGSWAAEFTPGPNAKTPALSPDARRLVPFAVSCGMQDHGRIEAAQRFVDGFLKKNGYLYKSEYIPNAEHQLTQPAMQLTEDCYLLSITGLGVDERQKLMPLVDRIEAAIQQRAFPQARQYLASLRDDWGSVRKSVQAAARKTRTTASCPPGKAAPIPEGTRHPPAACLQDVIEESQAQMGMK